MIKSTFYWVIPDNCDNDQYAYRNPDARGPFITIEDAKKYMTDWLDHMGGPYEVEELDAINIYSVTSEYVL